MTCGTYTYFVYPQSELRSDEMLDCTIDISRICRFLQQRTFCIVSIISCANKRQVRCAHDLTEFCLWMVHVLFHSRQSQWCSFLLHSVFEKRKWALSLKTFELLFRRFNIWNCNFKQRLTIICQVYSAEMEHFCRKLNIHDGLFLSYCSIYFPA